LRRRISFGAVCAKEFWIEDAEITQSAKSRLRTTT
jgi:hypothetical protein